MVYKGGSKKKKGGKKKKKLSKKKKTIKRQRGGEFEKHWSKRENRHYWFDDKTGESVWNLEDIDKKPHILDMPYGMIDGEEDYILKHMDCKSRLNWCSINRENRDYCKDTHIKDKYIQPCRDKSTRHAARQRLRENDLFWARISTTTGVDDYIRSLEDAWQEGGKRTMKKKQRGGGKKKKKKKKISKKTKKL